MIYSITSSIDTTLYEQYESKNTGLDEVLQLQKIISESNTNNTFNSRILTKFNLGYISSSILSGDIANTFRANLKMYTHEASSLPFSYDIYAYAASQSWDMGIGRDTHNPKTTEGASWKYRDGQAAGTTWETASADLYTGTDGNLTTQTTEGGATWWTGSVASQSFEYQTSDINMNVTGITKAWLSQSWFGGPVIANDGFIVKRLGSQEYDGKNYGDLTFFSKETHTIYQPKLEFGWDDFSPVTASLSELDINSDVFVYVKNNRDRIHRESKERIRIVGRSRFVSKSYSTTATEMEVKHFPTNSYWSVEDYRTGEVVIAFDNDYTKISCDSEGNYFDIWMDQFETSRRYKFVIRSISGSMTKVFDDDLTFKVID